MSFWDDKRLSTGAIKELLLKVTPLPHDIKEEFSAGEVEMLEANLAWFEAVERGETTIPPERSNIYHYLAGLYGKYLSLKKDVEARAGAQRYTRDHGINEHKPRWKNQPENTEDGSNRNMTYDPRYDSQD